MQPSTKSATATGLPADRKMPKHSRSAITNGNKLLVDLDHRGAWARRFRDMLADQINDLGGAQNCSSAELALIRCAVQLRLQLELLEQKWADRYDGVAPPKRLQEYQRVCNTLRRVLETLGLQRRAKDVTPSVADYVAHIQAQEADDAA